MTRKERSRRRVPGGRTTAAVLTTVLAATGITFVGLGLDEPGSRGRSSDGRKAKPVTETTALARASKTGKSVEVTALRTTRSTTWARPDGKMAKKLYSSPVRAKVDGAWKDIDYDLRRTEKGWEPKATNTRMVFSAGSEATRDGKQRASRSAVHRVSLLKGRKTAAAESNTLVTLTVDGHDIHLTWPGAVPAPIIDGSRALYPEIFPGADLVLTADDDGFAQLLVLKNRQAAADPRAEQLSYGITSADLSFRLNPITGVLAAEDADGEEVALSPTPLMWDSSGAPAVTDGSVGASAQPTDSESPDPVDSSAPSPSDDATAGEEELVETDEQFDPDPEELPVATDGPAPTPSDSPPPTAPAEPTPEPSQTGSAATLGLPGLDGPSPDSRGELVETDLRGSNWLLTPDQDFLDDPATTYPVFVDPSVTKHIQDWTTAYSRHPNATFYNGKGFNKGGTHEARVGFESDTWGTSRSYFNIDFDKDLKGTKIESAKLYMLETYSWSCSARSMSVHLTGKVNGRTNWKNAPKLHDGNKITTKSFAHGYKSGCRDAWEAFNVRSAAQKKADEGRDSITFGMRARDENSQYAWKKFQANGEYPPVLELVYNRKPSAPTSLDLGPDAKCTTTQPYARMGSGSLTFTAKASDKDKNLEYLDFDLWPHGKWATTGDLLGATGKVSVGSDKDTALRTTKEFATSKLTNGTLYSWRVRAWDDAGSSSPYSPAKTPCRFVLDTAAPKSPKVSSTDFPNADTDENGFGSGADDAKWSTKKFGTAGAFTVRALNTDVVRYEYGFNAPSYPFQLERKAGTATTVSATLANAKPPTAGPNVLYVRTVDGAGNVSQPTKYFFYVSPRDQADSPGDFTGDKLPDLMVVTEAGNLALYPSQATNDLTKGSGDLDYSMTGAYRSNPAKDPNGDDLPPYVAAPSGHFKGALITHNGDIYGGDGLQDLVVRVGGKLWVYPGDGYGAVNIDKRVEILLPEGAPSPSSLTQIVSTGDATGDGRTDFFATSGDELWAFTGYHGATIDQATRLSASAWTERDIVTVLDITGDGVTDMVYRTDVHAQLMLRKGKAASGGGTDLDSLSSGADSSGGTDLEYGSAGWSNANIPLLIGTPDANGDTVPDVWTVRSDGSVRFYAGGKAVLAGSGTEIVAPASYWKTRIAIG
ncbi:DNRLRE domain-containing protein [Streptomyces griseiscabiei]|uniref:DNRLRE domain-containing protein n=1 Tax=Streptomyces griseiscabiei TaxID=2993540 RepID=A0ABU4LDT5_9ACTN|nr:DNRLRE domain-containing protein [Streptomyces griseiscabiei]MBZ3907538.1 DNRLRE domain-containing protein [Streptomyces griseiscabiei]MDX2913630.1 DNRLRE domain-containing protein [Streptomyces griseiscabiei]